MKTDICVITGGSRGIGLATAMRFAPTHRVVIAARGKDSLDDAKSRIEGAGGTCTPLVADVATADGAQRVIYQAAKLGPVEVVINNAGAATLARIDQTTDEEFTHALAVNLGSVFYMTRTVWPVMRAQRHGVIINISSVAATDPFLGFSVYGACKAWVNTFTKATADEGKPLGIRVFAIAPGGVETGMFREHFPDVPSDQILDPDSVAAAIQGVCDDRMAHCTGQVIVVRK